MTLSFGPTIRYLGFSPDGRAASALLRATETWLDVLEGVEQED